MKATTKALTSLLLAHSTSPLCAQNTTALPITDLAETVVTASRIEEDSEDSPHITEVITKNELLEQGFRTLPEALALTPGVSVQKTTHGHGSPFIRGFTGRQNLYLIDGVRLNNSTYRGGPVQYANTIDSFGLERFELVKSQGSVLYGSDALGGTLNALTASSGYLDKEAGWFIDGDLLYRFDTNSESHLFSRTAQLGQGGRWGLTFSSAYKDFGDIRSEAYGRMKGTGYPEDSYSAKLEFAAADNLRFTFAAQYLNQDDVSRWHSTLNNPGGWEGLAAGTYLSRIYDQERFLSYARMEHEPLGGFIKRYQATLSYQTSQDSEFQNRGAADMRNAVVDVDTYGFNLEMESDVAGTTLAYGADYYEDRIDSLGSRNGLVGANRRPLADDAKYRSLGLYAQARTPWSEKFETTVGARYTRSEAALGKVWDPATSSDISAEDSWDSVVFNARALYRLNEVTTAFGGISQGFRAPNVDDLSGNLTSRSGTTTLGNLDLEPEKTMTFELGTRTECDAFTFEAAVFHTLIDDLITNVPATLGSGTTITTNASEAWISGIEAEAAWRFADHWTLSGFLTWQYGDADVDRFVGGPEVTEPVSRLSPLRGSLALRYDDPSNKWWAEARVIAAAEADRLSSGDLTDTQRIPPGGTPSYIVTSLNGGWRATDHLDLMLGLQNITNEDYRIHGSGVNEAGFGAQLGARIRW